MTRDEILSAIRSVARQLRRAPTRSEFTRLSGISHFKVLAHFSSLRDAIRQAGFEPNPQGQRINTTALLKDWAAVAKKLGKFPSRSEYLRHGRYSAGVFTLRFGSWTKVAEAFAQFVRKNGLQDDWADVQVRPFHTRVAPVPSPVFERIQQPAPLPPPVAQKRCVTELVVALIVNTLAPQAAEDPPDDSVLQLPNCQVTQFSHREGRPSVRRSLYQGRPVLGSPLSLPGLAYEPANETGVVFLFGMLAHHLGFRVECLQAPFPDCEAVREVQPGKWQRVRIEFEFESRNFQTHRHSPEACDVIVCWRHNWLDCPETIDVVELSGVVRQERV